MSPMFQNGYTALIKAANEGHVSCVEVLVQAGANLNTQNNDGKTALAWAKQRGKTDCVALLEKAGAK